MEFYVMAKAYNQYGGHTSLYPIGNFLLADAGDFGRGIREITVTLYFPDSGPAKRTLESLLEKHNNYRATLPKVTYRRSKGKVEIDIASELMSGREWKFSPTLSLPLFRSGVIEVIGALRLIKKRLKSTDAFDLVAFLGHCEAAKTRIPESEDALQVLGKEINAAAQVRRDAMSEWEKLGIDWEDFHPDARTLLDDPFYWNTAHDFAPNGNDTGADLLAHYRDWLKTHKNVNPTRYLDNLAEKWGYGGVSDMDDDVRWEASIALAFADIKLRGKCDKQAQQLALDAIAGQRVGAEAAKDWEHRDEKRTALDRLEAKLRQVGSILA